MSEESPPISLTDLAEIPGVSRKTVSQIVNERVWVESPFSYHRKGNFPTLYGETIESGKDCNPEGYIGQRYLGRADSFRSALLDRNSVKFMRIRFLKNIEK